MRNKKHIMYTHPMCRFYVKSSDSAVAHGASQCLCHHRGPRAETLRSTMRNGAVRRFDIDTLGECTLYVSYCALD